MSRDPIYLEGVSKAFPPHLTPGLKGLSAAFPMGTITGLVGPDGAGKSTAIRMLAGLLSPDEGTVSVFGSDDTGFDEAVKRNIAYMPQRFGLYEDLSVLENLHLYAELRGIHRSEREDRITELMQFTGLAPFTARLAGRLSGGMKQKLGLACSLILDPKLLLLDEPSVGVDPISRRDLWQMTHALAEKGIAVVWSSSYMDEAARCDTVILLSEGEVLFQGKPDALANSLAGRTFSVGVESGHRRRVLKALARNENIADARIQGNRILFVTSDRTGAAQTISGIEGYDVSRVKAVPPTFEDAFMAKITPPATADTVVQADTRPCSPKVSNGVIDARGLTKKFGRFTAAEDVTFKVEPGEIFGLLGPNGAGKSTTFKMLCGLQRPTAGTAFVAGLDLTRVPSVVRGRIGYMAQKFSLYGDLSVRQNLKIFAQLYGLGGAETQAAIDMAGRSFGLTPYMGSNGGDLPMGFQRRLALAAAIMHSPDILFLDEPTSGVDPHTRREFWDRINRMSEDGVTVVVTTHFLDEAEYCDRIALMDKGRIIASGEPGELKQQAGKDGGTTPTLEEAFIAIVASQEAPPP